MPQARPALETLKTPETADRFETEATLRRERPHLVALCARITGDRRAAEDLAQETLIEAWRHWYDIRDGGRRGAWLAGIARNVCRHWTRSRGYAVAHQMAPISSARKSRHTCSARRHAPGRKRAS